MSESAEDSPPAPSKPLLLTTFISDAGLPTFQLNQGLPDPLLAMFESILKYMVRAFNELSPSLPPRASSTYSEVAARNVPQRPSRPVHSDPSPPHSSANSNRDLPTQLPPLRADATMTLFVRSIPKDYPAQEFRNFLKSRNIKYLRVEKPEGRGYARIRLASLELVEDTIIRL
jgi:hypothetical protein